MINKLKRFEKKGKYLLNGGIVLEAAKAIKLNTDLLETLNAQQMLEGKDATGQDITPEYRNREYAAQKPSNPKRKFLTPNLKDTGDFHQSLVVNMQGKGIIFNATDIKKAKLLKKYGEILGLNDESLQKYYDLYLKQALVARITYLLVGR